MESANWKKQKVQLRRGTAAEWAARDTLLLPAEPGYETDTGRIKVGDGLTRWNALGYWGSEVAPGDYGQVVVGLDGAWTVDVLPGDIGAAGAVHSHDASAIVSGVVADARLSGNVVFTTDARLSDAREWSAETISQAEAEAGSAATRRAFTAQRVFQAIAAWWNASSAKTKLDGIAAGATANSTDAQLRDRTTHTGAQAISTITGLQTALDGKAASTHTHTVAAISGLSTVATSGSYNDLTGKPTIPSAYTLPTATSTVLGGVIVGAGLNAAGGTVSVTYGSTAGTACQGNDARLSDARAPTSHTHDDRYYTETEVDSLLSAKQAAGTYATLVGGTVPASQLPSYVDDVLEYSTQAGFPGTGEVGKIYLSTSNNKIFRWSGTTYIEIVGSPGSTDAVPEGTTNLYFTTGRASSAAPVQSVAGRTGAVALAKADVGLGNVDNTSDATKPISTAAQAAIDARAPLASPVFSGQVTVGAGTAAAPAIASVTGTSDTGPFFPAADTWAVSVGGIERLRVESDGNVRIGTEANAVSMLEVQANSADVYPIVSSGLNGPARASVLTRNSSLTTGSFASYGFLVTRSDGTQQVASIGAVSNADFLYAPHMVFTVRSAAGNNSERMRITGAGDVGIGTSTPSAQLHVAGNAIVGGTITVGGTTSTATGLSVLGASSTAAARTALGLGSLSTITPTGTASSTTYLRGDGTWAAVAAGGGSITDGDKGDIIVSGAGATWTIDSTVLSSFGRTLIGAATAADAMTWLGAAALTSPTFTGQVGFGGAAASTAAIDVTGNAYFNSSLGGGNNHVTIRGNTVGLNWGALSFTARVGSADQNIAGFAGYISANNGTTASGGLVFYSCATALTERMRLTDSGRLGIGTTAPTATLHVIGTATVSGGLTAGTISGTAVAFSETRSSPPFSAGILTLNAGAGTVFVVQRNAAITRIVIQNVPSGLTSLSLTLVLVSGGTFGVTWDVRLVSSTGAPATVKWANSLSAPTLTSVAGKVDVITLMTYDTGTTWLAFIGGQGF